jgi:hypothetical protein
MAKLDEPSQTSSQNLTLVSFSIFHLYLILATFAAQSTPFQKFDAPTLLHGNILGLAVFKINQKPPDFILVSSISAWI